MGYYRRQTDAIHWKAKRATRISRAKRFCSYGEVLFCEHAVLQAYFLEDELLEVYMGMKTFDDVFGTAGKDGGDAVVTDANFSAAYPVLAMLLMATPMVNGKRRRTATMTTVCEDGQVKLGLRDRDRNVSLWVSGGSFTESLTALEDALNAPVVAWRRIDTEWSSRGRQKGA